MYMVVSDKKNIVYGYMCTVDTYYTDKKNIVYGYMCTVETTQAKWFKRFLSNYWVFKC